MNISKRIIVLLILLCSIYSCKDNEPNNNLASSRINESVNSLKHILINEPNGWHITYFPNVDKQLNTDITENIKTSQRSLVKWFLRDRIGVGGYNIYIKFQDNGFCQMFSDIPNIATTQDDKLNPSYNFKSSEVSYKVFLSDNISIMFTNNNPIENLFENSINASSTFRVISIDKKTKEIVLSTSNYEYEGREFIVMKPLSENFDNVPDILAKVTNNAEVFRRRLYESINSNIKSSQRCFFIITTKDDNQEVYRSTSSFAEKIIDDRIMMHIPTRRDNRTINLIYDYDIKRYTLFVKNEEPDKTIGSVDKSQYYTAIGSGYVPTTTGIYFYPGFNYLNIAVFRDFTRVNDKEWIAENGAYKAKIVLMK